MTKVYLFCHQLVLRARVALADDALDAESPARANVMPSAALEKQPPRLRLPGSNLTSELFRNVPALVLR